MNGQKQSSFLETVVEVMIALFAAIVLAYAFSAGFPAYAHLFWGVVVAVFIGGTYGLKKFFG